MDAKLINPFINATTNVLSTMAQTTPEVSAPALKKDSFTWGVVTGIIGLAGEQAVGNMILSFDEGSIVKIVSNMLMEQFDTLNNEVVDAVGELTNMISGGAKKELNELGFSFDMAQPIMIKGQGVEIKQLGEAPVIAVPFRTDGGKFVLEASLQMKS